MSREFVSSHIRTSTGNRAAIEIVGVISRNGAKLIVVARGGGVIISQIFDGPDEAALESEALIEHIMKWEESNLPVGAPSNFLKLSTGETVRTSEVKSTRNDGNRVFLRDGAQELLIVLTLEDEEAAAAECESINRQLDDWERFQATRGKPFR